LQPAIILERRLKNSERTIFIRHAFNGRNVPALGLNGQHSAGFHHFAAHMHSARTALAGITAHMGAG
jgi:hypothetical protein